MQLSAYLLPKKKAQKPTLKPYFQKDQALTKRRAKTTSSSWLSSFRRILTIAIMALAGTFVFVNIFHGPSPANSTGRRRLCVTGSLKSMLSLRTSRFLTACEVDTVLDGGSFDSAFGEPAPSPYVPGAYDNYTEANTTNITYAADDTANITLPGGDDNVAFVVTIPSCPEDTTVNSSNTDPGDNFYDAAAVLKNSVCNCTAENPDSGSNYTNTMYAVIHPDAIECLAPVSGDTTGSTSEEGRRLQVAPSRDNYDRIAILEELGYYVIVYKEPVAESDVFTKIHNAKDLMSLYAYNLTNHPVSVMVNFDTVFTSPIDDIVVELTSNTTNKKAKFSRSKDGKVNPGIVFLKPDSKEFNKVLEVVKNTPYDETTGWNGTGVVGNNLESLLTFHFDQDTEAYEDSTEALADSVVNFKTNKDCGEPWDCKFEDEWDAATQQECTELNQVWYRQRKNFEGRWSKNEKVDTTQSSYHTDAFMGYCAENGKYQRASDFSAGKQYAFPVSGETILLSDYNSQLNALTLPVTKSAGQLGILSLKSETKTIPVARSYDGQTWEASSGFLASRLTLPTCDDVSGLCTFATNGLPPPEVGESYALSYYEHDGFGDAADAARFLEQTTFGGSLSDITSLVNTGLDYGTWLTEQISSSIMTSHREYYRRRLNKESEYSNEHFGPGPYKACDPNSQWRAYALSERDGIASHQSDTSKYLSIREMNGPGTGAPYLWLVEGMVRTVTNDRPKLIDGPSGFVIQDLDLEPVFYEIEFGVSNSYKWNCVGCPVRVLTHNADGSHGLKAYVANPKVDLTNFEAVASYSIVNLPNTGLSSINNGDEFRANPIGGAENWFAQFNAAGEEFVMTQQITDACQDHPITASAAFTHLSQLNSTVNPGVNADRHVKSAFPPIFGKVLNTVTQQEDYLLYSPKLYVPENTPENPLPDGGKMLRDLSAGAIVDTEHAVTRCSNVPRNFLNEQHCRLASAEACSSTNSEEDGLGVVVCGSIGEVSNSGEESFGGRINAFDSFADATNDFNRNMGSNNDPYVRYKNTIWANIALSGQDQLRQRMAWALYQLIPIGSELSTDDPMMSKYVEGWTQYYDIFVRNAFGNFKDVLKQIAYNPAMARWLSFIDNKSLQFDLDNGGPGTFPDENFAREIMQLFSIGIYQISASGAIELDSQHNPLMTYDTNDLMSFARVWTGFTNNGPRGNAHGEDEISVDPLSINPEYHDVLPKSNLEGGYLGDGYPLCADLPDRVHFRKGAIYRLLGSRSSPELQKEGSITTNVPLSLVLDSASSPLYAQLCQANSQGVCTFPGYVTLGQNLDYSGAASTLAEYANVETFRTVQVQSSPIPIYYEYVRPPCVETHFFNNGKKAVAGINNKAEAICANPALPGVASPACCSTDIATDTTILGSQCVYYGERMSYQETVNRCSNAGSAVCVDAQSISWETPYAAQDCSAQEDVTQKTSYSWTATDCQTKVKLSFPETVNEDPQVSRVDYFDASIATGYSNPSSLVSSESLNFYKVHWMGSTTSAPTTELACNNIPTCTAVVDGCICDANIIDSALYYSSVAQIVSVESLLSSVFLGAVDADVYDAGIYTSLGNCGLDGVLDDVHVLSTSSANCASLDINTIFTVTDQFGVQHRRKNIQSTVEVISTNLAFRNPVHYISMLDRDERDIHYEVDALVDHLFYYKSHAPFLAVRMIQRFGISNPSPAFIERVSTAYKMGLHANFGSGEYGDLEALVAAILLDPESRSVTLDADPSHGQIREPMLKLTGYIRSMEGMHKVPTNWAKLSKMDIGQNSYGTESVFSFFLPEFEPAGVIGDAGLVSPEAGVLSGSYISNLLEGLLALSKFGMTNCGKGIVSWYAYNGCSNKEGDFTKSEGELAFVPSNLADIDTMLDEFSLLLTAGRLGAANRRIIKSVVLDVHQFGHYEKAARIAQQLIAMTPEYHTTNLSRRESTKKRTLKDNEGLYDENDYKAVVYWLFKGGVDSYNLIVPLDDCVDGRDMFAEYTNARKYVALKKEQLLNISTVGSSQVCDKFAVNGNFPILQELYNDNDALFIANSGVITRPIDKNMDWASTLPGVLFAHNHMQKESQAVDPLKGNPGTGVGGRMMDMLKKNGFNTAANTVHGKALLNQGDSKYNNPSWNINTRSFQAFDPYSSVGEDVVDIIKELNGVTSSDTSIYGETWSSNVNQMIYEIEQEETIFNALSSNNLDISNYGTASSDPANQLRAVAKTMKARHLRKVNRDIYYVHQRGYDDHFKDLLAPKFQVANTALTQFVTWLKAESLWDNTVILMASEFGRTVTPNPRGGTDHAWGGNYFMVGGGVKGGQIVGEYPTKLTNEYDYWTGRRGRMIPSTSNDAIWNGIATWMGVKGDEDLNFILPTRPNFPKCTLFTDEDLFDNFNVPKVSSCTIDDEDGDLVADDVDYCQGTKYWIEGLEVDEYGCALPTPSPPPNTPAPTISKVAHEVANVLDANTKLQALGATKVNGNSNRLVDGTTNRYQLVLADGWGPPGFIATPGHGQPSIVHGIRIYMSSSINQNPTSFELQGRNDRADGWTTIAAGPTHMSNQANAEGQTINSTPYEPDTTKAYREILFSNINSYMQYRVVFPTLWYSQVDYFSVAEIELPGRIIYNGWTPPPSQAPTTPLPTTSSPTTSPTFGAPSVSMAPSAMPSDRCAGVWAEGEEKVVLSNNYDSVSGLAWKSTVIPVIPGFDGTGQAAMMYYSASYARQPAIRQGVSKTILNDCVRAGMRFQVTWRVKLLDGADDTQGYPCTLNGSCPTARFRIRQEDQFGTILCNGWYAVSRTETSFDVGGWNFKSEIFTIPSKCTGNTWKWFFLDLHNGHNFAPYTTKMIVDDTKIVLLD